MEVCVQMDDPQEPLENEQDIVKDEDLLNFLYSQTPLDSSNSWTNLIPFNPLGY